MKQLKIYLIGFAAMCVMFSQAQEKKVAVVTFGVNKYVGVSGNMSPNAATLASIAEMANSPKFNLTPVLDNFGNMFFNEYSKTFPFVLIPEDQVTGNPGYKSYHTIDTNNMYYHNCLMRPGYNLLGVSFAYKQDLMTMIRLFPDADGFMFVDLSFQFQPKVAYGNIGVCGINAYASIYIWNKNGDKVLQIWEGANSTGTVPMLGGIPVIKLDDILPLCQNAADKLLKDLKGRLPKIIRKCEKKL